MTPLQRAKAALLGRDVVCAIGRVDCDDKFQGHGGVYRIVGLTAKTVIVAYLRDDGPNLRRKTSIKVATGDSTQDGGVLTRMHPAHLLIVQNALRDAGVVGTVLAKDP